MIGLLPLIVGAAVLPLDIFMVLLLLRSEGGVARAAAFAAGAMTLRVLQGILFGYVFRATADAAAEETVASTLLLVVGILLLITAAKIWLREVDPDAPPSKWMTTLGSVSALTAFGMGACIDGRLDQAVGFHALGHRHHRRDSVDSGGERAGLSGVRGGGALARARAGPSRRGGAREIGSAAGCGASWLERNSRATMLAASLLLGMWFLVEGNQRPSPPRSAGGRQNSRRDTTQLRECNSGTAHASTRGRGDRRIALRINRPPSGP